MEGVERQAAAPHAPGAAQDTAASDDASMYSSLANFKVARQVGSGQFSCVFKAVCTAHPSRPSVALKKVKIFEMMDAKSRADCIKEIELLRQCTHPNIITYLGSFIEENVLNIVLEFAAAGDLTRVRREHKPRCNNFETTGRVLNFLGVGSEIALASRTVLTVRHHASPRARTPALGARGEANAPHSTAVDRNPLTTRPLPPSLRRVLGFFVRSTWRNARSGPESAGGRRAGAW